MFILRFIGRILSIGFILFIMFIISGKSAKAGSAWRSCVLTENVLAIAQMDALDVIVAPGISDR